MSLNQDAIELVVFDAYGTLLDINSAVAVHQDALGELTDPLSAMWRQKQLEYSWLTALRGDYRDFWQLTESALVYAFKRHGLDPESALFQHLLDAYWRLKAFDDCLPCLTWLQKQGFKTAILSNGSPEMLRGAVEMAGISSRLNDVFSVDEVQSYKPNPKVYAIPLQAYSLETKEVLFVSSNPWDVAGAKTFGFQVAWLNRTGANHLDELEGAPDLELQSLSQLPDKLF